MREHDLLSTMARHVRVRYRELLDALISVETERTARVELEWTLAALDPPQSRVAWLNQRAPIGTVYVAAPATMPMYSCLLFALAPAVMGNRVVLRAASASRAAAHLFAEIATESGADLAVAAISGQEFARRACDEADGMVIAGSRDHIRALDAQLPARAHLIGQGPGVSAAVVTPSADLDEAARLVVSTRVFNSSQDCLATERVYVADEVFEDFAEALLGRADTLRLGPNADPTADLGPLLIPSAAQQWFPELDRHGRLLRPGGRVDEALYDLAILEAGAVAPAVVEETLCPILPLVRYQGQRQLQRMLAAGDFALGLTVFGELPSVGDTDFAHIAVNQSLYDFEDAWSPFGGYRDTTLVRDAGHRRSGPVLIPHELSEDVSTTVPPR